MSLFEISAGEPDITVKIDPSLPTYAKGAAILATLSNPPTVAADKVTTKSYLALCRIALLSTEQIDPEWSTAPQLVIPSHLLMNSLEATDEISKITKKLDIRMGAAQAAAGFLQEAEAKQRRSPASRRASVGVEAAAMRIISSECDRIEAINKEMRKNAIDKKLSDRFPKDVNNFETRVVRSSLSVIHIAFAAAQAVEISRHSIAMLPSNKQEFYGRDVHGATYKIQHQISFADVMFNLDVQNFIIARAENLEPLLPKMRRLRPKKIVRLRCK